MVLYFDENDELVDEETAKADKRNYYHKYHAVEVEYGRGVESEDMSVKDKITKDLFCGEKSTDNAQIFLEALEKSKARHLKKIQD